MASGMPDYQTMARPKFGGANIFGAWKVVTANAFTTLLEIAGKGMIYGGVIILDAAATQKNSYPAIYIDGSSVLASTFDRMNTYNHSNARGYPLSLMMYDEVNFKYSVHISYGITYETSLKIQYSEAHGDTPNVNLGLAYTIM